MRSVGSCGRRAAIRLASAPLASVSASRGTEGSIGTPSISPTALAACEARMLPTSHSADVRVVGASRAPPGAQQTVEQTLAGRAGEEQREHAAGPALELEQHAGQIALARERRIGLTGLEPLHGGHLHLAGATHEPGERAGGVARADAHELAHTIDVRLFEGRGFVHVSWFTSRRKTGRPSPSTVRPASPRAPASMRGSGFT